MKVGFAMKTIGLIGGMSCESSAQYYHLINQMVRERLGGFHSALSLMYSVDFADIEQMQCTGDWMRATELMIDVAQRLQAGGADCVLLCSNTMNTWRVIWSSKRPPCVSTF